MFFRKTQEQEITQGLLINPVVTYPKIQVSASTQTEPFGIILRVTLQETKDTLETVQTFQLSEIKGKFDSEKISSLPNLIPNLSLSGDKDKVTLEWRNPNALKDKPLQLHVLPQGDLVVKRVGKDKAVELVTTANIITQDPIRAKHLSLKGRKIIAKSSISSPTLQIVGEEVLVTDRIQADCVKLHANTEFCNQGIIESRTLEMTTSRQGRVVNQNTVRAKEKCNISGPLEFNNTGLVDATTFDLSEGAQFINSGSMISQKSFTVRGRENEKVGFRNSGEIVTKAFKLSRITEASNRGTIIAHDILKSAAQYFENLGNITAKVASLKQKHRFVNTKSGVLRFDKLFRLDCDEGLCKNAGLLFVKEGGATQFVKDFRNSGRYISEGPIIIFADGRVRNKGPLVSKNSVRIFSEKSLVNAEEGTICSEGPAELLSKSRIKNYSKIKSGEVSIDALDFKNLQEATVSADKTLLVSTLKKIKNKGFLGGQTGVYLKSLKDLLNEKDAVIRSGGPLGIQVRNALNQGKIESQGPCNVETEGNFTQLLEGSVASLDALSFKVQGTLSNAGGLSSQHKLDIWARDIIRNTGLLKAPTITIRSECILDNLMQGIILAGEKLNLFSREIVENSGIMLSKGPLKIEAGKILKNLKDGKMAAYGDMLLLAGHILSNAGKILGDDKVTLQAVHWFENALGAEVVAGGTLTAKSGYRLDNFGKLEARDKLYAEALEIIHNHQTGVCAAQSLEAVSKWALRNEGILHSESHLKLEVDLILENCRGGRITALDSLQLLNASLIRNSGEILSKKSVLAHAKSVLHNLHSGVIQGNAALSLLTNFAFENSGQLLSERITVEARSLFKNGLTGSMHAGRELKLKSEEFALNYGEAFSRGSLTVQADTIKNFAGGALSASEAIKLIAKHNVEQAGRAAARRVTLEAPSVTDKGTTTAEQFSVLGEYVQLDGTVDAKNANIAALTLNQKGVMNVEKLVLNIQEVFKLYKEGRISVSIAATVLTRHLILMGQLMGKGECRLEATESFEYSPDTLWACGLLKLIMHKDYCFKYPMNILGKLKIESDKSIRIQAPVHVAKESDIVAKNWIVEEGGIFSAAQLKAYVECLLQINRGACFRVDGSADFTSPKLRIEESASFMIGGDCTVLGDFTSDYTYSKIMGQFHQPQGVLVVRSHESDRRAREIERARREAERRRDEGLFRSVLGAVVSIGASFFLGPLGPFALGLGKFGFLAQGAISGGLGAAVAGRDPIEGAVSSAGFALFGNLARNALEIRVSSKVLRDAILAGSNGVLDTCIKGGDPFHNVLSSVGSTAVTHCSTAVAHYIFPTSYEFRPILSQPQILQEVGKTIGRSLIVNGFRDVFAQRSFGERLLQAGLDGLQAFATTQSQHCKDRNMKPSFNDRLKYIQKINGSLKDNDQNLAEVTDKKILFIKNITSTIGIVILEKDPNALISPGHALFYIKEQSGLLTYYENTVSSGSFNGGVRKLTSEEYGTLYGHREFIFKEVYLNQTQLNTAIDYINEKLNSSNYQLLGHNCIHFVKDTLRASGISFSLKDIFKREDFNNFNVPTSLVNHILSVNDLDRQAFDYAESLRTHPITHFAGL